MPSAETKIVTARVGLLFDCPFFGHLALGLEPVEKKGMWMPTMATDGRRLYYDPDFVLGLPLEQLKGIIVHEILHCGLNHIPRRQGRDMRWNIACDFAVNDIARKDFDLPPGVLIPGKFPDTDEFANQSAEFIYSKLPEPEIIIVSMQTCDSHEEWEDWDKNGKDKGEGEGEGKDKGASGGGDGKPENGESGQNGDEEEPSSLEQEWRERVAQAATSARMAGKLPGHLEEIIGNLLQPKLDWKHILQDMITSCVKNDFRIMPPNKKHLHRGIYLPSMYGEEINIAVAIDTSGSISSEEMREFLSEVKGICDTYSEYTIWLFACDTQIHQEWELHPFDPLPEVLEGRGGTSFKQPLKRADELPGITSIVYLTDLCPNDGYPEEPAIPVIWVSVNEGMAKPPYGFVIYLPREN